MINVPAVTAENLRAQFDPLPYGPVEVVYPVSQVEFDRLFELSVTMALPYVLPTDMGELYKVERSKYDHAKAQGLI